MDGLAAALAGAAREGLMTGTTYRGRRFFKMTGSGNDFVFFDGREKDVAQFEDPSTVQLLCARGTGVGADGVVIISSGSGEEGEAPDVTIRYYNADGSRASLCGNATLCTVSLAVHLGMADPAGFRIATDAGSVRARLRDSVPEFDLPPIHDASSSHHSIERVGAERRLGYATAGVPHVVIRVPDVDDYDVEERGRAVRHDKALPAGANVNFVSEHGSRDGTWRIRTYERGVEGETLACGTGSVAAAVLLQLWGEAAGQVELQTRSGRVLTVSCAWDSSTQRWFPSLRGEGRLVFAGELGSL